MAVLNPFIFFCAIVEAFIEQEFSTGVLFFFGRLRRGWVLRESALRKRRRSSWS
jgi:hypothetical protein